MLCTFFHQILFLEGVVMGKGLVIWVDPKVWTTGFGTAHVSDMHNKCYVKRCNMIKLHCEMHILDWG